MKKMVVLLVLLTGIGLAGCGQSNKIESALTKEDQGWRVKAYSYDGAIVFTFHKDGNWDWRLGSQGSTEYAGTYTVDEKNQTVNIKGDQTINYTKVTIEKDGVITMYDGGDKVKLTPDRLK